MKLVRDNKIDIVNQMHLIKVDRVAVAALATCRTWFRNKCDSKSTNKSDKPWRTLQWANFQSHSPINSSKFYFSFATKLIQKKLRKLMRNSKRYRKKYFNDSIKKTKTQKKMFHSLTYPSIDCVSFAVGAILLLTPSCSS